MASQFKYKFQKNRTKILTTASILLFIAVGIGLYFLLKQDGLGGIKDEKIIQTLAESIVTADSNGTIIIINTETLEETDSYRLPEGTYLYSPHPSYDGLYAYDGTHIYQLSFKNGKIHDNGIVAEFPNADVLSFKVDSGNVAFLSKDALKLTFYYNNGEEMASKEIEAPTNVVDYLVVDSNLYYSAGENLFLFNPEMENTVHLGDMTDTIVSFKEELLIHNRFGSELQNSILLVLDPETLLISEVEETKSSEIGLIPMDEGDESFYTVQYMEGSEPYHLVYEWKLEDGRLIKNENQAVKIPVGQDGIAYNHETTVGSKGYLYVHFNDRLDIFDVRSQNWHSSINGISESFAMPVLAE